MSELVLNELNYIIKMFLILISKKKKNVFDFIFIKINNNILLLYI